jgi:hypothetical protein
MSVKRCGFSRRIGNVSAANLTKTLVNSPGGEGTYQLQMSVKRCRFNRRIGNVSVTNLTKPLVDSPEGEKIY